VLAAELRTAIMRTSRRLRQERSTDDVTPGQYSVLAVLDRHGPCTPRELAAHEKVQPPSMTRTVAALADLGLVGRTEHPTDGRQVLVSLSEQGRVVVGETRRRRDAWLALRLAELTPAERDTLADAAALLLRVAQS
jgi:DNA-binding MarR family transcriptional regulator